MATEAEIQLGRLAVERGLVTQEQVLTTLRERNEDPGGAGLGERLVARGLFSDDVLQTLKRAVDQGHVQRRRDRHEVSTDHQISLTDAREAIARESLNEAEAALATDPSAAVREIRRLAEEFADTESGNRAAELLRRLGDG